MSNHARRVLQIALQVELCSTVLPHTAGQMPLLYGCTYTVSSLAGMRLCQLQEGPMTSCCQDDHRTGFYQQVPEAAPAI